MELLLALVLLEILADPLGSDNNQEFVEFSINYSNDFNSTLANYSFVDFLQNQSFLFADAKSNDTLEYLTTIGNSNSNSSQQYLLIVEEGFNYSQLQTNNTCHIFSAGATIGNGLGNDKDTVSFYHNNSLLINESYVQSGCEGCSLHSYNGSFIAREASPCSETTLSKPEPQTTCELNLSLEAETIYELGEAIRFTPKIIGENYTLTYWWEDLYGTILKKPVSTTNNNPKQYTPSQPEGEKDFAVLLYARLENHCNETQDSHLAVVKGEEQTIEQDNMPSSTSSGSSGTIVTSFSKPLFTFSAPTTSYTNVSLTTTIYYPEQQGIFGVASYAYRGSANYSSRERYNISVNDMNATHSTLTLEPGNYSIKTQVWYPGRKTPEEERRELIVLETPVQIIQNESSNTKSQVAAIPKIQGKAVQTQEGSFSMPWLGLLFGLGLATLAFIRHRSDDSEKQNHSLHALNLQDQNLGSASQKNTTLHRWIAKEESQKVVSPQKS